MTEKKKLEKCVFDSSNVRKAIKAATNACKKRISTKTTKPVKKSTKKKGKTTAKKVTRRKTTKK